MYKYKLLKMFHHDLKLQIYMYDFIYVVTETMAGVDVVNLFSSKIRSRLSYTQL